MGKDCGVFNKSIFLGESTLGCPSLYLSIYLILHLIFFKWLFSLLECKVNDEITKAILHTELFENGTKGQCIKYGDEWLTPNQFEIRAGSKLNKYKYSIKYQGKPLETYIKSGDLVVKLPKETVVNDRHVPKISNLPELPSMDLKELEILDVEDYAVKRTEPVYAKIGKYPIILSDK